MLISNYQKSAIVQQYVCVDGFVILCIRFVTLCMYVDKYQIHVYLTKVDPPIILKLKQSNIFLRIVSKITEVLD